MGERNELSLNQERRVSRLESAYPELGTPSNVHYRGPKVHAACRLAASALPSSTYAADLIVPIRREPCTHPKLATRALRANTYLHAYAPY